jgi:acyl-coenzyme A synthetase/AMP-(fatty) acid ligase
LNGIQNTFPFLIDHWWQTESGWPMIATMMVLKFSYQTGSVGKAVCGYNIKIFNEEGIEQGQTKRLRGTTVTLPDLY